MAFVMIDNEEQPGKSKSQVKREFHALQELGRELVALSGKALHRLPLSEATLEVIFEAKHLKMEALRRQTRYIGKLLRDEDVDALRLALNNLRQPHVQAVSAFHEVEQWRDDLLAGDDKVLEELAKRFPAIDRQHVRQLLRNARKEETLGKPPKSARALFRYLRDLAGNPGGQQ